MRFLTLLLTATLLMSRAPLVAGADDRSDWSAFPGDGFVPVNAQHVHDPTIVQIGTRYFCFSTSGNGFGVLRSSRDLVEWEVHGPVLPQTPAWLRERIPRHRSLWAPDVVRTERGLRMFYCASEQFGWNNSYVGVAECDPFDPERPTEGWRDLGMIMESRRGRDHFNAIDPDVIADEAGRLWMFFGSYYSGIHVVELDPASGKLLHPDNPQFVLVARNLDDDTNALEAPAIIRRGDHYYLFLSYGLAAQGVRSTYRIGVGRSESITGPFVDHTGKPMVEGGRTMILNSSAPMFGPGHCDVLQESSGRWLLAHHYYDARKFWVQDKWGLPTLQVREIIWSDDGWPLPGMPVGSQAASTPAGGDDVAGEWVHQVDFGEPSTIRLSADNTVSRGDERGTWAREGDLLTLRWPKKGDAGEFWIDRLQLAHDGTYYVGRNQNGVIIRGARVPAAAER